MKRPKSRNHGMMLYDCIVGVSRLAGLLGVGHFCSNLEHAGENLLNRYSSVSYIEFTLDCLCASDGA